MNASSSFVIAISGGSGSGKSTIVDGLIERLGGEVATQFHEDAYYWPLSHYGKNPQPQDIDYDSPKSKDVEMLAKDLAKLKGNRSIRQPVYDFSKHDRLNKTRILHPAPIILLEGIHVLSIPEISKLIDLSVYVDTSIDLRLARRIRRDVVERGRSIDGVLQQYMNRVRPAHYRYTHPAKYSADLVIADEGSLAYGKFTPSKDAVDRMLAPILDRIDKKTNIKR